MSDFDSEVSPLPRVRLGDRIGMISRLLFCSLLAIVLAVASVQVLTLRSVRENGLQQAQQSLSVSMAVLRHELAPLGTVWSATTDGGLLLGSTRLNGRNDLVDAIKAITGASATIFLNDTRIATNVQNADGSRGIGTKLAPGPAYDAVIRDGRSYTGFTTILGAPYLAEYAPILDQNSRRVGILFVGVPISAAEEFMNRVIRQAVIGGLIISLLAGFTCLWALGSTTKPLRLLTAVMHRIAEGELDAEVPARTRTDQIGLMARALIQLRDAAAHARALEEAATARAASEAEKRSALVSMVDSIEAETTKAISTVGSRTAAMTQTAEKMAASAARTGFSAASAASASGQALATAQTVASAAEQLSASIREIGLQVNQSSTIVERAVTAGRETRGTIEALSEQVSRVGAVADMINEIAGKTNLLALNATIEAARAGDAGKGFAVVASEVKALANQTARATDEIAQRIAEIRNATGVSVAAVSRIEQTIGEINAIAGSIAAAVEEQGSATAEIARNVAETAAAANEMTRHANEVSVEAEQTGERAAEVCNDATGLNAAVTDLQHSVIRIVRTSATDLDRRHESRYPQDLTCRIDLADRSFEGHLDDLSEHGACVRGQETVPVGTRGTLTLLKLNVALPFSVRAVDAGILHLAFELDSATAAKLRAIVDNLALKSAA